MTRVVVCKFYGTCPHVIPEPLQAPQSEMETIPDLIDPRQVNVFNALDQLSKLKFEIGIQSPELIVVGDQKSGKSSVLEGLVRFHFPVHELLCTRFPTKLILRRSDQERDDVWIDIQSERPEEERKRIQLNIGSLNPKDDIGELMKKTSAMLGVQSKPDQTPGTATEQNVKTFSKDILTIEKHGPNLPSLSLVDLPGLFVSRSSQQDELGRQTVSTMVRGYIESERTMVLLVVSAGTPFHNHGSLATIQEVWEDDPKLKDRVLGVITGPDRASPIETLSVLSGQLDSHGLRLKWHVVRNQDAKAREAQSLEERDQNEHEFFSKGEWQKVPQRQKGIAALRTALREMFWTHTRRQLPSIISEVRAEITSIESCLPDNGRSRADAWGRRQYLCDIAKDFEELTGRAVEGNYSNRGCKKLHGIGDACVACKSFFPPLGDYSPDSQATRLRANIRSLNRAFAVAMRKFGKTEIVKDVDTMTSKSPNQTPPREAVQTQALPSQDVINKYYTHNEPKYIDREDYEKKVAVHIEHLRGVEAEGEANPVLYSRLFERQSINWEKIAKKHLEAVWEAINGFVTLALAAVCVDEDVLRSLKTELIEPRLYGLREKAEQTLRQLLNCHSQNNTGFYDGFVDIYTVRDKAEGLASLLANVALDYVDGTEYPKFFDGIFNVFGNVMDLFSPASPIILKALRGPFIRHVQRILTTVSASESSRAESRAESKAASRAGSREGSRVRSREGSRVRSRETSHPADEHDANQEQSLDKGIHEENTPYENADNGDVQDLNVFPSESEDNAAARVVDEVEVYYKVGSLSLPGWPIEPGS